MTKSLLSRAGLATVAGAVGVSLVLAACSSSSSSTPDNNASSGGNTDPIKVGILWSKTGPAAPGYLNSTKGAEARIKTFNDAGGIGGRKIELVEADDASNVDGALAGIKKLIDQENVFAIINDSPFFAGAYRYTVQKGVPVFSGAFDGPEWADPANKNLFSYYGAGPQPAPATTNLGELLKAKGGTALGTVGYGQSQSSTLAAQVAGVSATTAGLTAPYINTSVPFGGVDFGAITLAMKDKGVDSVYLPLNINSSTALLASAKQNGLTFKVAVVAAGYGSALLADPPSLAANEGSFFGTAIAPFELETEATKAVQAALTAVGFPGDPDFQVATSYMGTDLLIFGLNRNGDPNVSQEDFITSTRAITDYDGAGVIGDPTKLIDLSQQPNAEAPPGWCGYYVQLVGGKFTTVPDASPQCGTTIS